MKIPIRQLIPELIRQVADGEDIANEDAANLFRWLDNNSSPWRTAARTVEPLRDPNHTYCKHCGKWRDASSCRADPYINAEPRTYCPIAK